MRIALVAIGALVSAGSAAAQLGSVSAEPQAGMTAPAKGGADDRLSAGASGWARKVDANGHMSEANYRAELMRQIADAEQMLGKPLTVRDRSKIRGQVRSDLIAWRKQYDPRGADYNAMRARWLVEEASLSPEAWAKQRVDWLNAQAAWILTNVDKVEAQPATRAH